MRTAILGLAIALFSITTNAWATTPVDKIIDNIQASGGTVLAVPLTGANIISDSASQTLTNKTINASSNTISNIADSMLTGQVGVPHGGTGASSFTLNGMIYGNSTSALQVTAAGTQFQSLQAGSGGVPAFDAVHLNQSAAVTGSLGAANGGTGVASLTAHNVVIGNGTSAVNFASPGTSGQVLTSNGASADPTFQALPVTTPTINNSVASPQAVTAIGGVSLSAPTYLNFVFAKGGTASATVVVTATPSITACTAAGQKLTIVSESSTDLFTLQNQADLASSGLLLNGPWTSGMNNSTPYTLELACDTALKWVEVARNN